MKKSLLLLGLLASFNANAFIINGSFESPILSAPDGIKLFTASSPLFGWENASAATLGTNAYAELRNNYRNLDNDGSTTDVEIAQDGNNLLELDTQNFNGGIKQTIAGLTSGNQYVLSFWYQSRNGSFGSYGSGNGGQNFSYSWNDGTSTTTNTVNVGEFNTWTQITRTFTAGSSNVLSFNALGGADGAGAGIDNVSLVAAVPEPETYGMMMLGLAMLGFASRRRKQ